MLQIAQIAPAVVSPAMPPEKAAARLRRLIREGIIKPAVRSKRGTTDPNLFPDGADAIARILFLLIDLPAADKTFLSGLWDYLVSPDPASDESTIQRIMRAVGNGQGAWLVFTLFYRPADNVLQPHVTYRVEQDADEPIELPGDDWEVAAYFNVDLGVLLKSLARPK